MKKTKKVSRSDIARLAGVSGTAVTYALSAKGSSKLKKETRDKILRIADELGYQPAFSGKILSTGKSYTIGLLLPEQKMLNYLHYMSIVSGISEKMGKTEYNLTLFFRSDMEKCMGSIKNGRLDGIIVLQSDFSAEAIGAISASGLPCVIVDYDLNDMPENTACVRADHEKLIRDAFDFFINKKCKSIMNICAKQDRCGASASSIITNTFVQECQKHAGSGVFGITVQPTLNFSLQIRNMLQAGQRWEAFLVESECLAELLIEELKKFSLEAEKDYQMIVSSTGVQRYICNKFRGKLHFENYYIQQQDEIGRAAWNILSDILNGRKCEHKRLIPYKYWKGRDKIPCYWNSASE